MGFTYDNVVEDDFLVKSAKVCIIMETYQYMFM